VAALKDFLKTTIVGGLVFLVPLVVLVIVLRHAMRLAGLLARTPAGRKSVAWLENSLLARLPQYRMLKAVADGFAHVDDTRGLTPVLVNVEGGWQPGYQLEPLQAGWVAVFLPQAPSPLSGNILYMSADKVRALGIPLGETMALVKCMGVGSRRALQGVDLTLPRKD